MAVVTVTTTSPASLDIEYETFGSPDDPALLLVVGFAAHMTLWDTMLCELLAVGGRYVIRFDNRDCGLSSKLDGAHADPAAVMTAVLRDEALPPVPYTLSDMANDAFGLLDELGVHGVHVVGASMGGMIAQTMAIERPDRVLSLTSIMSTPGDPRVGKPTAEALAVLLAPPPTEREAFIEQGARTVVWGSRRYADADAIRVKAAEHFDRSFYPEGGPRQLAAIYASGDRSAGLATLKMPVLVIHGRDDTLITLDAGLATAEAVPGAFLLLMADMGHDLPPAQWPMVVASVLGITS